MLGNDHVNLEDNASFEFSDNLLVLNYVMDLAHPALAHQVEVVEALAIKFNSVIVLTGKSKWVPTSDNIRVFSSDWIPGHNLRNVFRFYRVFLHLIRQYRFVAVFSHMTTVQSCLAGPILKIRGVNHFLWYAHAQNSVLLRFAYLWVTKLMTSTPGSCPLTGEKVKYLGQSINQETFKSQRKVNLPFKRFIHIGRADPSKNLNLIIETIFRFRKFDPELSLDFYGNPSGVSQQAQLEKVKQVWVDAINEGWLRFLPAVPRANISNLLNQYDVFIHAFQGSLDKALIEATMANMPVVTVNQEYINEFGSWGKGPFTLESELSSLLNLNQIQIDKEILHRTSEAIRKHSSAVWISKLENCLRSK